MVTLWPELLSNDWTKVSERKQLQVVGSTGCTVTIHGNPRQNSGLRLVCANLGDTRAILCRDGRPWPLSDDHKPSRPDERARIERLGGNVIDVRGTLRVVASTNPHSKSKKERMNYQGLGMTRSFGDLYFKHGPSNQKLVENTPEVKIERVTSRDSFLAIVSDGISDVLSNEEIVQLAGKFYEEPEEAAKNIVRTSFKKGSEDNLTALVVQFAWADGFSAGVFGSGGGMMAGRRGAGGGSGTNNPGAQLGGGGKDHDKKRGGQSDDDMDMFA